MEDWGQTSRGERALRRADRQIETTSPHVPLAAMGGSGEPLPPELYRTTSQAVRDAPASGVALTGDPGSFTDRRSPGPSNPVSPGHLSPSQEETASEIRQMREDMRLMQLQQQVGQPHTSRGESYKLPVPSKYDPTGHKSPTAFLFQCEQYFEAARVPVDLHVPIAATLLEEGASLWWRQHKNSWPMLPPHQRIQSWAEFKQGLQRQFTPITEKQVARDKLYTLRQLGSVQSYTALFRQLTFEIDDIGEADKLSCYVRGLKGQIKVQLALRVPNTLEEAMSAAEKVDVALTTLQGTRGASQYRPWNKSSSRRSLNAIDLDPDEDDEDTTSESISDRSDTISDREAQVERFLELAALISKDKGSPRRNQSPKPSKRDLNRIRCYECNQRGHYQNDCPLKGPTH